uniref:elongin-B-like n=1 Tax=Ciona intestinalis TaxID=7719 RepID=UPI000EF4C6A9|nr:elongin-B-like [Ciona intestinalis]|eukprot:XP_026690508.1 elongin-B-like [Ciona intestinalis]
MDVFFIIRREKTTIFADAKESSTVLDLKKIIQGILKVTPEDQVLYNACNDQALEDNKTLGDSGFTQANAKAQAPALLKLALKDGGSATYMPFFNYIICKIV